MLETIQKTLAYEPNNIEYIRTYLFFLLSWEYEQETVLDKFNDLKNALNKCEPKNGDLYYKYSKLFARIAGRKKEILNQANIFITKAI